MLFNDFYGMKTLIERFLNPNLLENLKKSEKEEDKLEVEKSTLFNRIIIKVMPSIMVKTYMEKGVNIFNINTENKEEYDKSCTYLGDLFGFSLALNNAVNLAAYKFKTDSYGTITNKIMNHFLIRLTRETWLFANKMTYAFNRLGKVLLKPGFKNNDILVRVKAKFVVDVFGEMDEYRDDVYLQPKEELNKCKSLLDKMLFLLNEAGLVGLDQNFENLWCWVDAAEINKGDVTNIIHKSVAGFQINIQDKNLTGLLTINFDNSFTTCQETITRIDKDLIDGQYR